MRRWALTASLLMMWQIADAGDPTWSVRRREDGSYLLKVSAAKLGEREVITRADCVVSFRSAADEEVSRSTISDLVPLAAPKSNQKTLALPEGASSARGITMRWEVKVSIVAAVKALPRTGETPPED